MSQKQIDNPIARPIKTRKVKCWCGGKDPDCDMHDEDGMIEREE